jgi:hypothetical protein
LIDIDEIQTAGFMRNAHFIRPRLSNLFLDDLQLVGPAKFFDYDFFAHPVVSFFCDYTLLSSTASFHSHPAARLFMASACFLLVFKSFTRRLLAGLMRG